MLLVSQPWIQWSWVRTHLHLIRHQLWQHVLLTVLAVGIGLLITFALAGLSRSWRSLEEPLLVLCGTLYAVPSIALFALLVPFTGFTTTTAEIGLVGYTLLILLRNLLAGLDAVPDEVNDAALGMGFGRWNLFWRVQLPLALPALFAGIRVATVTTIGLVTVTALIGQGGLGAILYDGFERANFRTEEVVGAGLTIILALAADLLLVGVQRAPHPVVSELGVNVIAGVSVQSIANWFTDAQHWHGQDGIPNRLVEHLRLSGFSLAIALAIALPVGIILGHLRRGGVLAQSVANLGRAIPSLAILIVAVPIVGIGSRPAEIALVALALPPLLINTYVGMAEVDDDIREAAAGMGMTGWQAIRHAELPIALPLILAGLRTAAFQVVATATLAAVVASGGLGRFIIDGLAVRDNVEVVCGSIVVVALAIAVEVAIAAAERVLVAPPLRTRHRSTTDKTLEESINETALDPA